VTEENQHSRTTVALALVGTLPFLVLAAWHWRYGPLVQFGDWAQYMSHAEAIRHGRPYGDIGYIFTSLNPFIGPPVEPPGLPAALVPLLAVTGGAHDSATYKWFMIVCGVAFLVAAALYLTRYGNRPLAFISVLVTGVWLESGFATNVVQPDVACCAFLWVLFYVVDAKEPWSWPRVVAVSLLGLLAIAFRLAALPVIPALAVYAAMHRRALGARPLVPVLVWCVVGAAAVTASAGALTFARLVPRDPGLLVGAISQSARIYPFATLDLFLYPFPWNRVNDAYHLVVAAFAVVGAFLWLPRLRSHVSIVFAAMYIAMLLVLPMQDGRYLMPLAPLAPFLAGLGIASAARRASRLTKHELTTLRAVRLSGAVMVTVVVLALARELARPRPQVLMEAPGVRALFARLQAARDSGTMRVVFVNPRVLTWETGVPAMGYFRAGVDTTLAEFRARRITHVVVGDLQTDTLRAASIRSAVNARPDAFRRLYTEGAFTVFAFDSTRGPRP
jgi:hypothetical protein